MLIQAPSGDNNDLMWDRIRYLATPVPRYLRDMGYVRGLKRLDARGRRCEAAWAPHVVRSRSLILEAADRCGQSGKALVLGSGPLFDVPVKELSERFREVVLVEPVASVEGSFGGAPVS